GIATGYVFCGVVGDARRCDYTLIGDAVNVAARLMQSADETPLCDAATQTAVGASYLFDPLPPVAVKGKSAPVPVFSARARAPRPAAPFADGVDRTDERARLAAHLERLLTEGRNSVVIIEGEAGIGKSHLAADLAARASGQNVLALTGGGDSMDQAALYHAWRPVFRQVLGLEAPPAAPDLRRARVLAQLSDEKPENGGPSARDLAPLLSAMLSLDLPDNEATALLMGRERAEATHDLLTDLLRRYAESAPLLLIMEDVHWLDSASWALLLRVAERVPRRMLVVLTRGQDDPNAGLAALTSAHAADRLALGPLPPEDIQELACRRLGVRSLPEPVAGLIRGRTDGNPFFCEEFASALRDRGAVMVREGVCELAPDAPELNAQRFPETAQGVVLSRIDRLSPQQQLILKVASVIGRSFDLRTLRAIYPVPSDLPRLAEELDVLAGLDLTSLEADGPERRYAFKHAITQDVAYRLMLFVQRQPLHQAIARWYEDAFAAADPSVSATLAFHWARACEAPPFDQDVLVRAVAASQRAGELALRGNAAAEAITHLTRALALLARMPESVERDRRELELQVLVAIPYTLTRGWAAPPVEEAYRRAYALCLRGEEAPQLFPVLTGIFTYHLVSGQMVRADEISLRNWEYAERAQDRELQLEAEHDRCTVSFYRGDLIGCVNHAERVLQLFDPNAHQSHLFVYGKHPATTALCHVSLSHWCLGFPDRALEAAYAGVRQAEALPHPFS
ncbi:MAG: AAA family ATPase, partial [Armatimonadota bacterium]|nr:AAA family ATPase [Armatimonadota bacterium]